MLRKTLIAAGAFAALTTAAAVAQPAHQGAHRPAEVIGVVRAVAIAEGVAKRQVLEAEMDYEKGRLVYEVKAAGPKGVHELLIDALSGEIVSERPLRMDSAWQTLRSPDKLNAVRAGAQPLSQMLAKVEAERGSRVHQVELERERGQTYFEVDFADDGRKVLIDPRTGKTRPGEYDD